MKAKVVFLLALLYCGVSAFQVSGNKPLLFIDGMKTEVTEGMYINCLKIDDLIAIMPLNAEMNNYDMLKFELHRFGTDIDIIVADKTIFPSSREYQKKYANKSAMRLKILIEETDLEGSDLIPNTKVFPADYTTNMAFCKSHDLKHCSFYMIVRGYKKTGEKTQFDEDVFDNGTDLSAKSVVFTSWEDKRIK